MELPEKHPTFLVGEADEVLVSFAGSRPRQRIGRQVLAPANVITLNISHEADEDQIDGSLKCLAHCYVTTVVARFEIAEVVQPSRRKKSFRRTCRILAIKGGLKHCFQALFGRRRKILNWPRCQTVLGQRRKGSQFLGWHPRVLF